MASKQQTGESGHTRRYHNRVERDRRRRSAEIRAIGSQRVADAHMLADQMSQDDEPETHIAGSNHLGNEHIIRQTSSKAPEDASSDVTSVSSDSDYRSTQSSPVQNANIGQDQINNPDTNVNPRIQSLEDELHELKVKQDRFQQELESKDLEIQELRQQLREAEQRRISGEANKAKYEDLIDLLNSCRQQRDELETEFDQSKRRERELKQRLHEASLRAQSQNKAMSRLEAYERQPHKELQPQMYVYDESKRYVPQLLNDAQQRQFVPNREMVRAREYKYERDDDRGPPQSRRLLPEGGLIRKNGKSYIMRPASRIQRFVHS